MGPGDKSCTGDSSNLFKKHMHIHRWAYVLTKFKEVRQWDLGMNFSTLKDDSSLTTGQRASTTDSDDPYTSTQNAGNNISELSRCVNDTIYHNVLQIWKICKTAPHNPDDKEKQEAPSSLSV